jgi:predicted nucleic acid-binding protein
MIFVDTSAWYALIVPSDPNHSVANEFMQSNSEPLLTSDYFVDEILTLLSARREPRRAVELGTSLFSGKLGTVAFLTEAIIHKAWILFRSQQGANWTFTDCTSKVLIDRKVLKPPSPSMLTFANLAKCVSCPK